MPSAHTKCLVKLYNNRARKVKAGKIQSTSDQEVMSDIAFAELVMYIEETCSSEDEVPFFKAVIALCFMYGAAWNHI